MVPLNHDDKLSLQH